jgi:4a-hydroxytetrahydrobiopterin dehydratase
MPALPEQDIRARLASMPGWTYDGRVIAKTYAAPSFNRAVGFVVQISMLADVADHHPDLDIRYNHVTVALATHSAGGVTEKDFALAEKVEKAFAP